MAGGSIPARDPAIPAGHDEAAAVGAECQVICANLLDGLTIQRFPEGKLQLATLGIPDPPSNKLLDASRVPSGLYAMCST